MSEDKLKILFCEEDSIMQMSLQMFFERRNIGVYFARSNGRDFLDKIQQIKPYVIVPQIFMGTISAEEIFDTCKKENLSPQVFLVTGSIINEKTINTLLEHGYEKYLLKPYGFEYLLDYIEDTTGCIFNINIEQNNAEHHVCSVLHTMGVPSHMTGYGHFCRGITMAVDNPALCDNITKELYLKLAKQRKTTEGCVERAMRVAIDFAWDYGRLKGMHEYFGQVSDSWHKPSNSEIITIISHRVREKIKNNR